MQQNGMVLMVECMHRTDKIHGRRHAVIRPSLSSADECTAVHVWAQSSLPGCVCANVMMAVVSVRI